MYLKHYENLPKTVIFGEEGKFTIEFEIVERHPFLHFNVEKMPKSTYENAEYIVLNLKAFLGAVGYPIVYGAVPKDKKSLVRLYERLGFEKIAEHNGHTIYQLHIKEPDNLDDVELTEEEYKEAKTKDDALVSQLGAN